MGVDYEEAVAAFEWDIPEDYDVPSAVAAHADTHGDRVAVTFRDEDGTRETRTFAEIDADARRFADALAARGIGPGDRVMHLFPRHPDAFAVQLGVLRRGALVVPCSAMLRPDDLQFRATDCEATAIVCHESLVDMVEPIRSETPLETLVVLGSADDDTTEAGSGATTEGETGATTDGETADLGDDDPWESFATLVAAGDPDHEGPSLTAEDPMSINYTSGTTGKPKPVLHRHRWVKCFELVNAPYWWGYTAETDFSEELMWATTGTGWAKWFWSPVGVGLTTGAPQFLYDGEFDPETFLDLAAEEGVTRLCAVPTQYRMFAQLDDLASYDVAFEELLSAGEPLNREPIAAMESAFGVTPRDGYGQTETVALVTNYPGIDVKPGSMGRPTPGVGTTVIDTESETPVDPGEIGEIAVPVDSPAIFDGYYEKPALDDRTFDGDYYRTGDLASVDEDGYLFFEGRADDIIISAGYRIGPFEVEDALIDHPAVAEAAVVESPHDERGAVVKAFVVLADGYEGSDDLVAEIQSSVKEATAPYKYPRRIEFVDELPKTSSGKIRRVSLRERERDDE